MRDVKLKSVQCVQDLRVKFSSRCMFSHCNDEANKVNRMLGFIKRNFSFKNKDAILPPYNTSQTSLRICRTVLVSRLVKDVA